MARKSINRKRSKKRIKKNKMKESTREGYGKALEELGKNKKIVVMTADLGESTKTNYFKKKYPKRHIEVGVAEQNLVTVASGIAATGKIPLISSFAIFCPGRSWEQIRTTICYNNQKVIIAGGHAGITTGEDGATHQALEDIALMRVLPNMTIIVPCDYIEAKKATIEATKIKGPVYIRLGREKTEIITKEKNKFKIGKAEIIKKGKDIAIIACGIMVEEAIKAGKELEKKGIKAMIINNHTIKPLDEKTILKAAKKCKKIITAEEHQIAGGLGSTITEFLSEKYPIPIKRIGIKDKYGESGKPEELKKKYGLTSKEIIKKSYDLLSL